MSSTVASGFDLRKQPEVTGKSHFLLELFPGAPHKYLPADGVLIIYRQI